MQRFNKNWPDARTSSNDKGQMLTRALQEISEGPDRHHIISLLQLLFHADPITLEEATYALAVEPDAP
jgi:hypothetical protein